MTKYTLLTGSTGLVGQFLVRDLLLAGHRLALVVRPTQKQTIDERVEAILQMWESKLDVTLSRPIVFAGDVSKPGLGLSGEARSWLGLNCDRVIHNAAVLTFTGSDRQRDPWLTNATGTQHILELCRELKLADMHYVSTAYVCGQRCDTVYESEFDQGQDFRNDYEHSKFVAEKLMREADFLDQLTVYRPAVIAGDSQTGYTNTYHGLYLYLRLMSMLIPLEPVDENGIHQAKIRLNMTGKEPRNIVPVDWVSAVMCRLLDEPAAHGQTFHLAPIEPITAGEVINYSRSYFNTCDAEYCGEKHIPEESMNDYEREFHRNMATYESYDRTDPHFDTTNLLKFTADIPCPRIDEGMLHRYIAFGEQDRWGKRKKKKVEIPFSMADHLQRMNTDTCQRFAGNGDDLVVGLDILGPGGGQWQVGLSQGCIRSIEPGLPAPSEMILRMTTDEFRALSSSQTKLSHGLGPHLQADGQTVNGELAESIRRTFFSGSSPRAPLFASAGDAAANVPAESRASSDD